MSKKQNAAPSDDQLSHEEQMAFATMASLADIDLKKLCVKVAIGYAWVVCAYIAAEHAAVSLALLVSPLWLQLVILFFALAAACVGIVYSTPVVANAVYDAGAWLGTKAKSLFTSAKAKVQSFKPAATVH